MWRASPALTRPLTASYRTAMNAIKTRKIEAVRKEVLKANTREPAGPFMIALGDVRRDPVFQVRKRLVPENVRRLRTVYQSGKRVEPILIAFIDGEDLPFVLDGHHRYSALEDIGAEAVEAVAVATSRRQARWMAARANLAHGQPLTTRELRPVFKAYITTRQHVLGDGSSQSYSEIGAEIGVKKATVYDWMRKDFPDLFRKMGREDVPSGPRERPPVQRPVVDRLGEFRAHLQAIRDAFEAAHPDEQFEVMRMMETALGHFREVHEVSVEEHNPFRSPPVQPGDRDAV